MNNIQYLRFSEVDPNDFLSLLNSKKNREHLIEHELFDISTAKVWLKSKLDVDSISGCKVRAIIYKNQLAGWCGIQLEKDKYEIAIVIDNRFWGVGKKIFNDMMGWAKALGHEEIYIHFLHTRPDYKFLQKIAINVFETELLGNKFTTYQLAVN